MTTPGTRRHVFALTVAMLLGSIFAFGALVLLSHNSVRSALGQTAFVTVITYLVMLLFVRRTGHL